MVPATMADCMEFSGFDYEMRGGPECFNYVRADRLLLGKLQLAQCAVADVVVGDISARVVEESFGMPAARPSLPGSLLPHGVWQGNFWLVTFRARSRLGLHRANMTVLAVGCSTP
jgi:hypothetical protein